jgi:hypothetical protein
MQNTLGTGLAVVALTLGAARTSAEVVRVDVSQRTNVGASGYEKIVATVHFAVDPHHARNRVVVNLDKASANAAGQVEFSADLFILRPIESARSNGVALIEVSNRGRKGLLTGFNRASGSLDPSTDADLGDGLLTRQGYTLVWVGWQFDVPREDGLLGIRVPHAAGTRAVVRAEFTPSDRSTEQAVADLAGYAAASSTASDATLTVRDGPHGSRSAIARDRWTLLGTTVTMPGGFEPGRTYEIAYPAVNLPVAGLGFVALRDMASWIKYQPDALTTARHTIAWGSSQSGRFLRTFLYYGFNADERDRQAFDGVMAHIAGGARLSLNEAGAAPNSVAMFTATAFPYADIALRDPISGVTEGLLDNDRARRHQPKVFYTNSAVEYWGGGRSAALVHTTPDGARDLTLPDNVRIYYLAGTQHSPGRFPPRVTTGQQADNPVEYWWTLRALLTGMDRWVRESAAPPASQYPRLTDGTLVRAEEVGFPTLAGVTSPRILPGARAGDTPLPFLVPQVDEDGNDRAGIRSPEIAVPVATYTGWNFRSPSTGGVRFLVNLMGSSIPFPRMRADRAARSDPRRSLEERYPAKDTYLAAFRQHAVTLVNGGYLLADDLTQVMRRAEEQWANAATALPATTGQTAAVR